MNIQEKINGWVPEAQMEEGQIPAFRIPASRIHDLCKNLRDDKETPYKFLVSLIGMDWGDSLGVIIQLSNLTFDQSVLLKVSAEDRENPQIPSVSDLWGIANLYEREVFCLLGIRFIDHPDMRRLYLRSSWNGYPLRKDYQPDEALNPLNLESEPESDVVTAIASNGEGDVQETESALFEKEEYVVNIGPQHPATHGVLHFRVSLDGEIIRKIDLNLGYIHRGVEKMCEGYTYPQMLHLTDRLDYLSAHINRHALCLCVENALQLELPARVHVIRTMMDELTRVASHLLAWACVCMDMGALTAFIYGMRDREKILDIFEETCGGRLITNYNVIGGVMADLHPNFRQRVKDFIVYLRKKIPEYHDLFTGNVIAIGRLKGIGLLSFEEAVSYGVTGPSGRASGFSCDLRKYQPYAAYDRVKFNEIIREEGDSYARYMNRLDEISESLFILEQLVEEIPEGPFQVKTKPIIRLPEGEYSQLVEAARGIFGVYIDSRGDKSPYRVKFRSPCLSLVSIMDSIARGEKIADLIAMGGSLDYVVPDIDR
jgi:NADH-quinone oxidoreductase subunit C/D